MSERFWETKTMHEMTEAEWEAICDGCARCCLYQFEDEDTGRLLQTDVVCGLLDINECRCTDYENRHERMPGCIRVTPDNILTLDWMPDSCSYRRIALGRGLAGWHPLITGIESSTRDLGHSVRGRVVSANEVDDIEARIISWFEP
jgi:uncharacterized cysteine cluster protein YcgN (CxxCxxCC family)